MSLFLLCELDFIRIHSLNQIEQVFLGYLFYYMLRVAIKKKIYLHELET